jgi:hypothetical protein
MVGNNRISNACWYQPADLNSASSSPLGKWHSGTLRAWATDWEDFGENGRGQFPVGVIEDAKTGMCHSVYVSRICFASIPPGEIAQ